MTIDELLSPLGVTFDELQNYPQQFSGDINLGTYGKYLPQFQTGLFEETLAQGTREFAQQRATAGQDYQSALGSALFGGQTGLYNAVQPMATGFSGSGAQARAQQTARRAAQDVYEEQLYGGRRAYESEMQNISGREQEFQGALQQQALGYQSDVRSTILNLLRLDPTQTVGQQTTASTPPQYSGPYQNQLNQALSNFNIPEGMSYEEYFNNLFSNIRQDGPF